MGRAVHRGALMQLGVPPAPRREHFVLDDARALSDNVRLLVLRTATGAPFPWLAGQHVEVIVPARPLAVKRDYSIASAHDVTRPDRLELAVTRVGGGAASEALHALPVGTALDAFGPKGAFTLRPEPGVPVLFVAHGTGLAPLRAMLLDALAAPSPPRFTLLFGARTERDVLWGDELRALAAARPDMLRFEPTLTRPSDAWRGRRGRVQAHVAELMPANGLVQIYACGLRDMTDDVANIARRLRVSPNHIFTEEYD